MEVGEESETIRREMVEPTENSGSGNPQPSSAAVRGGKAEAQNKPEVETAPMAIFYGGQVMVFNEFPMDVAKKTFALASKSRAAVALPRAAQSPAGLPLVFLMLLRLASLLLSLLPITVSPSFASAQPPLDYDLPIARKNSLDRFLEKR